MPRSRHILDYIKLWFKPIPNEIDGKVYCRIQEAYREANIGRSTLLRWLKKVILEESIRDRRGWRIFNEEDLKIILAKVYSAIPIESTNGDMLKSLLSGILGEGQNLILT